MAKLSTSQLLGRGLVVILVFAALSLLITLPLTWQDQLIVSISFYGFCLYLHKTSPGYRTTLILMMLSIFCTMRYCWWRYVETWRFLDVQGSSAFSVDILFVALLLGAETYAAVILMLGYFQGLKPLGRKPAPLPEDPSSWPMLDVFIPTYNEPLEIVKPTVMAAVNMDYPPDRFRVFILDDGRRPEFKEFAEAYGVTHITRPDNKHAKAGNINAALKQTSAELVAIFDCDHVPTRSFLQMTVGWFVADRKLGMVQTPHHFYSPDPFEKNLGLFRDVPNESSLFYGIIQDGNDLWNATFFCGSCTVIRREALAEIGGVAVETVTEDAHTSLRMQRNGWNTAYINIPQAAGLATSSMADHIGQRIRWARGMVQILRIDTPLFGRGLSLAQRLCYFNSVVHYLFALPRLVFLTAPIVYLLFNRVNMYGYVIAILCYALPHLALATLTNSRIQGRHRHSFWNEVYETVLAPYILFPTMAALINPKWGKFNVTSKSLQSSHSRLDWHVAAPFVVLLFLNITGITVGILKVIEEPDRLGTIAINVFWSLLNVVVLGASVAAAIEKKQLRLTTRIPATLAVKLQTAEGHYIETHTSNVSTGGVAIPVSADTGLQVGDPSMLLFSIRGEEVEIPGTVVQIEDSTLRIAFQRLTLAQQESVAVLVFSRADFWNRWRKTDVDEPVRSFLRILGIAMKGLVAIPESIFGSMTEATRSAAPDRRRRRPVASVLLLAILVAALLAMRATGQSLPAAEPMRPTRVSQTSFRDEITFRDSGLQEPLALRGRDATATLRFGIPMSKLATDATVTLQYKLAAQLRPEQTRIEVSLNGSPVGSLVLQQSQNGAPSTGKLALPAELLMTVNQIGFHLLGLCENCSGVDDNQILTVIEPASQFSISGSVLPLPNELQALPQPFFDPSSAGTVRLQFGFLKTPDRQSLEAAAVVASWFGMQSDHRGAGFSATIGDLKPGNTVVIAGGLAGELARLACDIPAGPAVSMCAHPGDPASKILVVSGDSPAQALAAAQSFVQSKSLKGASMALRPAAITPRAEYDAPRWMKAGENVPFHRFALPEQLAIKGAGSAKLYFRLAPDLHFAARGTMPLRLSFRWLKLPSAASARLRVSINDTLLAKRSFRGGAAEDVLSETLQVPVASLYAGNTLSFDVEYVNLAANQRPEFVVGPESTLDLRGVGHFAVMPRLELFSKAGYPFTRRADLSETAFVLPDQPSAETIALALDTAAFLGAQTGTPALLISVLDPETAQQNTIKDLLIFGTPQNQPIFRKWAGAFPLALEEDGIRPNTPRNALHRFLAIPWVGFGSERSRLFALLNKDEPVQTVIQAAASPANEARTAIEIVALSPDRLDGIVASIEKSSVAGDIFGNASIERGGQFRSFRLSEHEYYLGNLSWMEAFDYWMTKYLLLFPLIVIFSSIPLAQMIEAFVNRKRRERLQMHGEIS